MSSKKKRGLRIKCFKCKKPITKPAALLFSPPSPPSLMDWCDVTKFHICKSCYNRVFDFVRNASNFKINSGRIK